MKKFLTFLFVAVFTTLARESTVARQVASDDRQMGAEEQAHRFCEENGLVLGFDQEKKVITHLSTETFEYESQMSDEEFAQRRYVAVQRGLVVSAMGISRVCDEQVDVHPEQGSVERWRSLSFWGSFVDDDDDKEWISSLTGRKFTWVNRLKGSVGWLTMTRMLCGISILGQFESLSEDGYKVVLIVSFDVEKGKKKVLAFEDGKVDRPGKMSLRQWIDTQNLGLIAGPRHYVDNEGVLWALGIVHAAEGQQPYGTMLDAVARDCAAFAFGGEIAVSVDGGAGRNGNEYGEKSSGSIKFTAVGARDWYPRELEQYFRRPYTHPLTGRKGVVAICALRSGASKFAKEIHERKIEKMREKAIEAGMRDAMREQLKKLINELDKVNAADDETSMRIMALGREISRCENELQQEQSLRKKNRERTTKKIVELHRKVMELKGGKGNENQ